MNRRGITLVEILISILIFGVGVVSLFTLFPLGFLNIRSANRYSRSAFLVESATSDLGTRNLLSKASFTSVTTSPWTRLPAFTPIPYDPWVQDTPHYGVLGPIEAATGPWGVYRGDGCFKDAGVAAPYGSFVQSGLPVAYDPLWRATTGTYIGATTEARFGSGIGFVRADPAGGLPSAHGLQRITNFPVLGSPGAPRVNVPDIFVSPDDAVLQSDKDAGQAVGAISPIVPDLATGGTNATTGMANVANDWKYTWMFTGQQADTTVGTVFTGDIVVFENRPFAVEPIATTTPIVTTPAVTSTIAGETVVEAIFGYTGKVTGATAASTMGYGTNANRAVLLRWSDKVPDPEIRVGGWFADVTYERDATTSNTRTYTDPNAGGAGTIYPYQRCHWYQVAKRTQPGASSTLTGYREMTVWTSAPLRALTLLNVSTDPAIAGTPYHVNAALISPYVVNVFPRTIYTR